MKYIAAALVVVLGIAVAWFLWPHDEPAHAPTVTVKTPKRIDPGKRPDRRALAPATIAGRVRDPQQRPLAGANVCITQQRVHRCVQSDKDGRYSLDGVLAEAATLGASLAKYRSTIVDVPAMEPAEQRAVDIVLEPGGLEITGIVEDILGGPIAQAHVTANGAHADCDDQGRFTLWVGKNPEERRMPRSGDLVFVTATAEGYGPRRQPMNAPGKITITLAPESSISGRVVDATTGTAIADARIVARIATRDAATTTSGPDGTFALAGLAAGNYTLAASAPGRYGELARTIGVGIGDRIEGIELRVSPARRVVVTLDVQGDRTICAPAPSLADWSFEVPPPWRDEAGRYHFDAVPPAIYSVTLGCGAEIPPLVVGDEDVEVAWRVETGGTVKGIVRVEAGPLVGIELARVGSSRSLYRTVAADRRFEFRGVPAGRYAMATTIDREQHAPVQTIDVVNGQTLEHDIVLAQRPSVRLSGTVVDDAGQAIASGTVEIKSTVRTDLYIATIAGGRFEIQLPSDRYRIEAKSGASRGAKTANLRADTEVSITVSKVASERPDAPKATETYSLWGRVVDAQHVPVADVIVTASGSNLDTFEDLRTTTDAEGKFRLASRLSQMTVHAYRIGGGDGEAIVRTDQPTEIVLRAREAITGTVTRPDGTPASRFLVRVGEPNDSRAYTFDHTGGRFEIDDKHTYPLRLVAAINDLDGEPVILTPQSPKTNIVLRLPKTVDIRGRIVDSTSRAPIPNVRLHGRPRRDGWAPWFTHVDQVTDADGRFTMRDVPPGPLMLEVFPPLDTWTKQTFDVTVPDAHGTIDELSLARARR